MRGQRRCWAPRRRLSRARTDEDDLFRALADVDEAACARKPRFVVVLSIAATASWIMGLIGLRAVRIADAFPAYRETFVTNVQALRGAALPPLNMAWDSAERWLDPHAIDRSKSEPVSGSRQNEPPTEASIAVEVHPSRMTAIDRLQKVLSWAWAPIGSTAIVIVVTIFALLERESLRDRFIRLVGGSDLRATTTAINDAGERLSRYLGSLSKTPGGPLLPEAP